MNAVKLQQDIIKNYKRTSHRMRIQTMPQGIAITPDSESAYICQCSDIIIDAMRFGTFDFVNLFADAAAASTVLPTGMQHYEPDTKRTFIEFADDNGTYYYDAAKFKYFDAKQKTYARYKSILFVYENDNLAGMVLEVKHKWRNN